MYAKQLLAGFRKKHRNQTIQTHRVGIRRLLLNGQEQQPMEIEETHLKQQVKTSQSKIGQLLSQIILKCQLTQTNAVIQPGRMLYSQDSSQQCGYMSLIKRLLAYSNAVAEQLKIQEEQMWKSSSTNIIQEDNCILPGLSDFEVVADLFLQLSQTRRKQQLRLDCLNFIANAFHPFLLEYMCLSSGTVDTQTIIRIWMKIQTIFQSLIGKIKDNQSLTSTQLTSVVTFVSNKLKLLRDCNLMSSYQIVNANKNYIDLIFEMRFRQSQLQRLILKAALEFAIGSEYYSPSKMWLFLLRHSDSWSKSIFNVVWLQNCCSLLQISIFCLPDLVESNSNQQPMFCLSEIVLFIQTLVLHAIRSYYSRQILDYPALKKKITFLTLSLMERNLIPQHVPESWANFCRAVVEQSNGDLDLEVLGMIVLEQMQQSQWKQKKKLFLYYSIDEMNRQKPKLFQLSD